MFRNYFLLNLLLILIILLLGVELHKILAKPFNISMAAAHVTDRNIKDKFVKKIAHKKISSYDVIATKNLFNPSRSNIDKPVDSKTQPVSAKEKPQLFGTIIMSGKKMAILEDKSTKKSALYKVNDNVSGFVLSKIMKNKVILKKDGESFEVGLREDKEFTQPMRSRAQKRVTSRARATQRRPRRVRSRRPRRTRTPVRRSIRQ